MQIMNNLLSLISVISLIALASASNCTPKPTTLAPTPSPSRPPVLIKYRITKVAKLQWDNSASTTENPISIYMPIASDGYQVIGQVAMPSRQTPFPGILEINNASAPKSLIRQVKMMNSTFMPWTIVFQLDPNHVGNTTTVYRPICDEGFQPISDFAKNEESKSSPSDQTGLAYACINPICLMPCQSKKIYSGTVGGAVTFVTRGSNGTNANLPQVLGNDIGDGLGGLFVVGNTTGENDTMLCLSTFCMEAE
jgi:hypothetical protein